MRQIIEVVGPKDNYDLVLKNKRGVRINLNIGDQLTIETLKDIPIADLLALLNISNYQLRTYLTDYRNYLLNEVTKTISKKWIYKSDNSPFNFLYHTIPGITTDLQHFKKQLKQKHCTIPDEFLEDTIAWFEKEDGEVKEKD